MEEALDLSFDRLLMMMMMNPNLSHSYLMVVPWFRRLVNGFSSLGTRFNCRVFSVVGFVVHKVELGDVEPKP